MALRTASEGQLAYLMAIAHFGASVFLPPIFGASFGRWRVTSGWQVRLRIARGRAGKDGMPI